ncbi:MAG: hypothetical protein J0H21_15155, partial [Rhizobiales bacterium]|nr:hypothetical protein [Hyphomicrobiales bacterium]
RARLAFSVEEDQDGRSLLALLRKVDRSFARTSAAFRARNRDGYLVDLIRPMREPPWKTEPASLAEHGGAPDADDLAAVSVEGLNWQENAPPFEAMAIDQRGYPTRIVASDPRAFAVHKLWLSARLDRAAEQRARDLAQARAVGQLVASHMPHLPFDPKALKNFPRPLVEAAMTLFVAEPEAGFSW